MPYGTLDLSTFDYLLEGFQVIGFDWRYKYVNEAAVKQSKFSRDELVGFAMPEKYPGIENSTLFETLQRCMHDRTTARIENDFAFPDGSRGWFELHIEPIPEGIFILSMDISDRKNGETELARLNEQLDEMVRARTSELQEKNRELMDSLRYAQEIQQAFLNTQVELEQFFSESFILYKPKHVVSGDFFWCRKKENSFLLAAGDCTGHGVPGALLSMLGIEKLKAASKKTDQPDVILRRLNKDVKASLQATSSRLKSYDGMDVALCSFSPDRRRLTFAGASRPLWLIRKGSPEIEQIKSSIRSIGGYTELTQKFQPVTTELNEGDTLYLFSDGYADTFGGPSSKKMTTRKFRELLSGIHKKPMSEQRENLENFLSEWKGSLEQTDDILVMGVRV